MDTPQPKPQPQKRNQTSFAVAPGNEPKGRQMCFRATPSLEKRIEERVSASGLKLADWLRQVVIAYLESDPLEPAREEELEQGQLNRDGETEDAIATEPASTARDSGQAPTSGDATGREDQAGDATTKGKGKGSPRQSQKQAKPKRAPKM